MVTQKAREKNEVVSIESFKRLNNRAPKPVELKAIKKINEIGTKIMRTAGCKLNH